MALRYDLRINQGETFQLRIPVLDGNNDPASLSGMTARGQIRAHSASPTVLHEWTLVNGGLAFDANNVVLTVPATASSLWPWRTGQWDLELVDYDGMTTRLIEGLVIVHPEVSR